MTKKPDAPQVKWGLIDRALEAFSPGVAAKRMAARRSLTLMRGYDAAQRGRGTEGWHAASTDADGEIAAAAPMLRARMRDLVRNNPMAAQAVQVLVNNIVGPGIRPRANTGNKKLDKKVDDLFRAWSKSCDRHGHTDFYGLQNLAVREMIEGGDLFAIKRPTRMRGKLVPLEIELREADHLDAARFDSRPSGVTIRQGIEYDAAGRRLGYWMFDEHPGSNAPVFTRKLESRRVPADRVAHLFERQRTQARGVPWGAPAMRAIRDVDDWQRAELVRKKTEACVVGVVLGAGEESEGIAPSVLDSEGNTIEQFEPGLIAYAPGGKDIKFNQPASTGGVYEWHRVQLHIIAAGFRVPYALMTGDLSQANFASSRVGLNEFRRMVDQLQWQTVIPMLCEPIWRWFIEMAQTAGFLPDRDIPVEWAPPRFESVNPLQDAQADRLEVRAGFSTLAQQIARRGYDPEEVMAEAQAMNKKMDEMGLVFDSDPRRVTQAGLAQQAEAETQPPRGTDQE